MGKVDYFLLVVIGGALTFAIFQGGFAMADAVHAAQHQGKPTACEEYLTEIIENQALIRSDVMAVNADLIQFRKRVEGE